jgi:hypothetical protein
MVPIEQKDWTKKTEPRYWAKITHSIPRRSKKSSASPKKMIEAVEDWRVTGAEPLRGH